MTILTKRIKDDSKTSATLISGGEYAQIVTDKGCFNITATDTGINISIPGCDKLTITPTGATSLNLTQIKG